MILRKFLIIILNLLYPPKCIFCGSFLKITANYLVCNNCLCDLPYLKGSLCCKKCGKPMVSLGEKGLCYDCLNETHFYFKKITSVFEYEGNIRNTMIRYKLNPSRFYASIFADMMYERFLEYYGNAKIDFLIGVPDSKAKGFQKTAGHVDLLCEEFSKLSDIPFYKGCLKKVKRTEKQSSLTRKERQTNLIGSIKAVNPAILKGKTCLLIDDICTTGSTIKECSKELKLSGCKTVFALTVCTTAKKPIIKEFFQHL